MKLNKTTVFELYKKLESLIEQGHGDLRVIADCSLGKDIKCNLRKLSDVCFHQNVEIHLKFSNKNDNNEMTVFELYKKLESFIEQGHADVRVIANCCFGNLGEYGICHLRKLSDECYYQDGEIYLKFSN